MLVDPRERGEKREDTPVGPKQGFWRRIYCNVSVTPKVPSGAGGNKRWLRRATAKSAFSLRGSGSARCPSTRPWIVTNGSADTSFRGWTSRSPRARRAATFLSPCLAAKKPPFREARAELNELPLASEIWKEWWLRKRPACSIGKHAWVRKNCGHAPKNHGGKFTKGLSRWICRHRERTARALAIRAVPPPLSYSVPSVPSVVALRVLC